MDPESSNQGKSKLKRVVSTLTRLIQRTERPVDRALVDQALVDQAIEYEYRDAEYE